MPVTLVKSKWDSGNLIFTKNDGTELFSIESDGTIDVKTAGKFKLEGATFKQAAQANSTASDIAGIVTDFNALLVKLRAAKILATS
jgi:hypothetical protein